MASIRERIKSVDGALYPSSGQPAASAAPFLAASQSWLPVPPPALTATAAFPAYLREKPSPRSLKPRQICHHRLRTSPGWRLPEEINVERSRLTPPKTRTRFWTFASQTCDTTCCLSPPRRRFRLGMPDPRPPPASTTGNMHRTGGYDTSRRRPASPTRRYLFRNQRTMLPHEGNNATSSGTRLDFARIAFICLLQDKSLQLFKRPLVRTPAPKASWKTIQTSYAATNFGQRLGSSATAEIGEEEAAQASIPHCLTTVFTPYRSPSHPRHTGSEPAELH